MAPTLSLSRLRKQARVIDAFRRGKPNPEAVLKIKLQAEHHAKYKENVQDLLLTIASINRKHGRDALAPARQIDVYGHSHLINPKSMRELESFIKLVHKQWDQIAKDVRKQERRLRKECKSRISALRAKFVDLKKSLRERREKAMERALTNQRKRKIRKSYQISVKNLRVELKRLIANVRAEYKDM
jgi:hypothetical protein